MRTTRLTAALLTASLALSFTACRRSGSDISPDALKAVAESYGAKEYYDVSELSEYMLKLKAQQSSSVGELERGIVISIEGDDIERLMTESASMTNSSNINSMYMDSMTAMTYYFTGKVDSSGNQGSVFAVISVEFEDNSSADEYYESLCYSIAKTNATNANTAYFDRDEAEGTDGAIDYCITRYGIKKSYQALLGDMSMNMFTSVYKDGPYVLYYVAMDIGSNSHCEDIMNDTCNDLGIITPDDAID